MRIQHAYSPEQYSRAAELWGRLLDCHAVSVAEVRSGYETYLESVAALTLYQLIMSDGEETEQAYPVCVTLVSYSDYGGSSYDAANVRALADDHPWVSTSTTQAHGGGSAWLTLGELPDLDDTDNGLDMLESLVDAIEGLDHYPLIDDESHTNYEMELSEEAWDAYLLSDVRSELEDMAGGDLADFGYSDEDIREMYYGFEETHFHCETATSVLNENHDKAVEHVFETILAAWRKPYVDPAQLALIAA